MFNNFGFIGSQILKTAENERFNLHHPYVGSEHLLLAILKEETPLKTKLKDFGLTYKKFRQELINIVGIPTKNMNINLYTPLLKRVISNALIEAKENNKGVVNENHYLIALLDEGEGIAIRIMIGLGINIDDLYDEIKTRPQSLNQSSKLEILNIGTNLNERSENNDKVIGRENEINNIIEVLLRKKKSNPLLVGAAGVGKTAIIEELARKIKEKDVPLSLINKTIIELPMGDLVSGTKYRGEFEERLTKIIKEVMANKNIIIFIDEVHTMVNAGGAEGAINAADILKPYLARGDLRIIGATTIEEYEKYIAKDKALERRFEVININEPDLEATKNILRGLKQSYEQYHLIKITEENINDIVYYGNKYLFTKKNPDKTIDLLDSICAYIKRKNSLNLDLKNIEKELKKLNEFKEQQVLKGQFDKALDTCLKMNELEIKLKELKEQNNDYITKNDILKVIEEKSQIPMFLKTKDIIENISQKLNENIQYENQAIKKLVNNLSDFYHKNISNLKLLLIGPSGVGKTSSVKMLSEVTKAKLIRLDMSEYNSASSVSKLIGTNQGYVGYDDMYIFKKIKYNPYSIILVDEIEKAHPEVLNLFLQILDEGYITDSHGEKINFKNTIIIMTSNAYNSNNIGFNQENNNNLTEFFAEEFLARFDDIIYFKSVNVEEATKYLQEKTNYTIDKIRKILDASQLEKYNFRYLNKLINKSKLTQ